MKNAIEHNNLMNQRNYGIDLLRIVSMFMVVILHVLGQGGVLTNIQHLTLKGEIFWGIEIACYCAVNCYALISGYVGINAKHKYVNIISLSLQVLFYSVCITGAEIAIALFNRTEISFLTIVSHLLPSITDYWYFSAYFL
jgi:surface polysaccharide O-acyltransferase-like enzyme